jgi:hypothetical protein
MPAGRPTHYSDEIARQARDYLANYNAQGDAVPSVAGLSIAIKRARSTIYQWAADPANEEFADILEQINATQEKTALTKGLTGDFNAQIVKLLLGKHGYHDKVDQELTGANRGAIKTDSTITFVGVNASSD